MNLQQLEYIISVDNMRHFAKAADACFVTQPTLSMMIQKLEEELDVKLFDRSKQPVIPTDVGEAILVQARRVLNEAAQIGEIAATAKGIMRGHLHIGIIPTVAPYLLPRFIHRFSVQFPDVRLSLTEMLTKDIVRSLKEGKIDCGVLATPLDDSSIDERVLYYEPLVTYLSKDNPMFKKRRLSVDDLSGMPLMLLKDGHCYRDQIGRLCSLRDKTVERQGFNYESGSLEALKNMVDYNGGITILPLMATLNIPQTKVRHFMSPVPVREISLITHRDFIKKKLIDAVFREIVNSLPGELKTRQRKNIIPVQ